MNTMQKVAVVVVLSTTAVWLASSASAGLGTKDWLGVIVVTVASGLVGTALVAVFARGTVIARLQRGTIVLALAGAVLALATPSAPDKHFSGWELRLTQYRELRSHKPDFDRMPAAKAMDAVDSAISEYLLADQPEIWRQHGRRIVACARSHALPVETVVAFMRRETAALRQPPEVPESEYASEEASMRAFWARRHRLDSLMADAVLEARVGGRRNAAYAAPTDVWVPDWPARSAVAGSVLLAGFAVVVVLGLLRRKPRKADGTQDTA